MKHLKSALIAASLFAAMGAALPTSAASGFGGEYASDNWYSYYQQASRPMMTKMTAADVKKVMEMEMALAKMEANHHAAMTKMEIDHKMTVIKMRQELEQFVFKGNF
jgi:hypothetical protein